MEEQETLERQEIEYKGRESTPLSAMPDKHGQLVAVGDFVRNGRGEIWRVRGLSPREGHLEGNVNAKTGLLDLEYSSFDVERPSEIDEQILQWGNLEPLVQTGVSIPDAERVDDPSLLAEFERRSLDNAWRMIDNWEGKLAAKRSELARRRMVLDQEASG